MILGSVLFALSAAIYVWLVWDVIKMLRQLSRESAELANAPRSKDARAGES
jgi:hypothetical protein